MPVLSCVSSLEAGRKAERPWGLLNLLGMTSGGSKVQASFLCCSGRLCCIRLVRGRRSPVLSLAGEEGDAP